MKGVILRTCLFLGPILLVIVLLSTRGAAGSETVVEGDWVIDEPTVLRDGTWILQNGTMRIESSLEMTNATLATRVGQIHVNLTGRLLANDSILTAWRGGLYLENKGSCALHRCTVENITTYGFNQYYGSMTLEDCEFRTGYNLLTLRGDLVMRNCTVRDITEDILMLWTSDPSGRPSHVVIESVAFIDEDDIDYTEIAIEIAPPTSVPDACRIAIRDCTFTGYDLAVEATNVRGEGELTITRNVGTDCGLRLMRCADGVSSHHNRWGGGVQFDATQVRYPRVHNESIVNSSGGLYLYSTGTPIVLWDITIRNTTRGVICQGGTVHVHRSMVQAKLYDWSIGTLYDDLSRIYIHETVHTATAYVGTRNPGCGVYELASMRFSPVSWNGLVIIDEGGVEFVNETGSWIGTWEISGTGPFDLPVFEASTTRNVTCRFARGILEVDGIPFESVPFDLDRRDQVPLQFRDDRSPAVGIQAPSEGEAVRGYDVEVAGTVSEVGSGLASLSIRLDSGPWQEMTVPVDGTWSFTFDTVSHGTHSLQVRARDRVGNEGNATVQMFEVDAVPPPISVVSPGHRVNQYRVRMEVLTEVGATATIDDRPAEVDGSGRFSAWLDLTETVSMVRIGVRDPVGNTNGTVFRIEIDLEAPLLVVEEPREGGVLDTSRVLVRGRTEADATVTVDGRDPERDDEWFEILVDVDEGPLKVVVVATDPAGNPTVVERSCFVDLTPPRLTVLRPQSLLHNTTDAELTVSGTLVDLTAVTISLDGVEASVIGREWFVRTTLREGINTLVLTATDAAGNFNSTTMTVRLDRAPPKVSLEVVWRDRTYDASDGDIIVGKGLTYLRVHLSEVAMVRVNNGPAMLLQAGDHNIEVTLGSGGNTVRVDAEDPLGNAAPRVVLEVYLDTTPPNANGGKDVTTGVGKTVRLDGSASTDDTGIAAWAWNLTHDGRPVGLEGSVASFRFERSGTYRVTLTVTDQAGNTATDEVKVVVQEETGPPVLVAVVIAAAVVVMVVAAFLFVRRRRDWAA